MQFGIFAKALIRVQRSKANRLNRIVYEAKRCPAGGNRMKAERYRTFLVSLYDAAVAAAQPALCLPQHFPPAPANGRLFVVACGKGAAPMAKAAEAHYAEAIAAGRCEGLCVTRRGYGLPLAHFELIEASHPVPDASSLAAAERALTVAEGAREDDLVLVLISGGASALWAAPAEGLTLADKQALTRSLLKAGATIHDINTVRKHMSRIKGGRFTRAAFPATVVTLAISDVPGDAPDTIGSGPTVPDTTTLADARAILARFRIAAPPAITAALDKPENETPKPDDPAFARSRFVLAAAPKASLDAAAARAEAAGYAPMLLGDDLEGEARDVARAHAELALAKAAEGRKIAIISGGELTVTIRGSGRGGPNQEYALALAIALGGAPGIYALAGDTDGSDGGSGATDDPAGAVIYPDTLARAHGLSADPADFLAKNDSTGFFEMLDDLVVCGPTYTNVNDLRVILVEPANS
jgi:glycerate 2-kinase